MGSKPSKPNPEIKPYPDPQYKSIDPLPPISDGITGFVPITTPRVNGWHRASPTGWGSWVFVDYANWGSYITASWNEDKLILRVWTRGCGNAILEKTWRLWEIGPIPQEYFGGGGRNQGNITFSSCCNNICTDQCKKDGNYWNCVLSSDTNPNWIRDLKVQDYVGINSPCPNTRDAVPCYFASDRRCVPQDDL